MGGGDLNLKKQWHPLTFKNQEQVWLAERREEQEIKKMEQLKKELEQERAMQELVDLNLATGRVKYIYENVDFIVEIVLIDLIGCTLVQLLSD